MAANPHQTPHLIRKWIVLCALAEFLGIGAAALWYGVINAIFGEPGPLPARAAVWVLMSLAAVPEGIILGSLQAQGIRWFLPTVSSRRLILATIAIGLLGWGIGTFIPMFLMTEVAPQSGPEPSLFSTAIFAATFGLGVGAVFGLAQSWALPRGLRTKVNWTLANMVGWAAGLPAIYIGAQIATDFSDWPSRIAFWSAGGLAAGALIGAATSVALVSISDRNLASKRSP